MPDRRQLLAVAALAAVGFARAGVLPPDDLVFANGFEGTPGLLLTVTNTGGGTVTSVPAGISCGATCSAGFPVGANVTLQARTANGSGASFTGWSGACSGSFRDCALVLDADQAVTATFTAQPYNLAFVSSASFAGNLGSAQAYDAQCNALATAAGINNAGGDAYVAWVTSFSSTAPSRLTGARGWVRIDGAPFADQLSALTSSNQVFNPIDRDEFGASVPSQTVLTGAGPTGGLGAGSCIGWSGAGNYTSGYSSGGPVAWTQTTFTICAVPARIYCLMKTLSASLTPSASPGSKVWITSTGFVPNGSVTPNQFCDADRPGGVASAKALIATTTTSAAAALAPAETYVRPDGQVVGTGAEIAQKLLRTGIWQTAGGVYDAGAAAAWTGDSADLTVPGTSAGTCGNWMLTTGSGAFGDARTDDARWWNFSTRTCSSPTRLICVEQ